MSSVQRQSLHAKLLPLPESLEVYPGHFSGSVCGAAMSGKPVTTLSFEKRFNPALEADEDTFVEALVKEIPAKSVVMTAIVRFNQGRA